MCYVQCLAQVSVGTLIQRMDRERRRPRIDIKLQANERATQLKMSNPTRPNYKPDVRAHS